MPTPRLLPALALLLTTAAAYPEPPDASDAPLPPVPDHARLVLDEDWSAGEIDDETWYVPRRHWGQGNHGVVPENVRIDTDRIDGEETNVLVTTAHGDAYEGPVVGIHGQPARVGGVIVSRDFFASGRFEVVMKIGSTQPHPTGPETPEHPIGTVPAIWTYAYRFVEADAERQNHFQPGTPLYNPHMPRYGGPYNEYWSELDFPEFGKDGDFSQAMYNTFLQNRHEPLLFDAAHAADGRYHTFTTEWRTTLTPLPDVTDDQVVEHAGYWWVQDTAVPFEDYYGNPLKRLGENDYAVYTGRIAEHWIDGRKVAENRRYVPAMAAQLTFGVWLPQWAGPAPWHTAEVRFASVKVWRYDDQGDVRGILTDNVPDNFEQDGTPK